MMRLWKLPRPDRKRLLEERAMTIAVGIKCNEGVVFCADRQITDAAGLKYERDKILCKESRLEGHKVSLMFTFAGNPDAARTICDDLWERLQGVRASQIQRTVKAAFKNRYSKGLKTLIAISRAEAEPIMYRTEAERVYDAAIEYIGAGDSSVVRYLAKLFVETETGVSLTQAKLIGCLLVSAANRSVEGCSGGPDLAVINQWGHIEKNDRHSAERYLWGLEVAERVLRKVFNDVPVVELEAIPFDSLQSAEGQRKAEEIFARNKGTIMRAVVGVLSPTNKPQKSRKQ